MEVIFFGIFETRYVLVDDPVNESNSVGNFMVILISSRIRLHKMLRSTLTWIFHPKRQLTIAFTHLSQEQTSLTKNISLDTNFALILLGSHVS